MFYIQEDMGELDVNIIDFLLSEKHQYTSQKSGWVLCHNGINDDFILVSCVCVCVHV